MSRRGICIVGAGQAGLQVALSLRERGYTGPVTLIGGEPHLPYHRPPMSKQALVESIGAGELAIRSRAFIEQRDIALRLGTEVVGINREARAVVLANGTKLDYQRLVLATGSMPRRLHLDGADLPNVASLSDYADLERLRKLLPGVRRAVLIGGGFIGLELASSLTKGGVAVTVLEAAPRILSRVASADLSRYVERVHRAHDVEVRTGVTVSAIGGVDRASTVRLACGEEIATDLVLVGIGAEADDRLAVAAGLSTDRGVLVDAAGRTSDPAIYAAGDCVRFDHPFFGMSMRIESVNNALDQARRIAASITGQPRTMDTIPWFWSDQFDLKIQLAGIPSPLDRIETVSGAGAFVRHYRRDGQLRAVEAVNAPRAFMQARRRIETEMTSLHAFEGAVA